MLRPAVQRLAPRSAMRAFLRSEAAGGILLMFAAALAMIVANVPGLSEAYFHALHAATGPTLSPKLGPMTVHLWINDALMALFFLLVGLEIKREWIDGHLSTWADRRLPVIAAAAGMVIPAMIYLLVTRDHPELHGGWAIPAATDIAFAIGVLALLGPHAPTSLKLFLTTVAIVDDMGAVAIIAIAYTDGLDLVALAAAAAILAVMFLFARRGANSLMLYMLLFAALWYAVLLSGVHATIAGVLAATAIPIKRSPGAPEAIDSPLHRLEHKLHKPVAYAIVPIFGFANAGVPLGGVDMDLLLSPLPVGIAAGLFVGKQVGIFLSVLASVKLGIAGKPGGARWRQIYGVSLLCGIGFTMSLFIGGLAFTDGVLTDAVKLGVLMGSLASAAAGFLLLRLTPPYRPPQVVEVPEGL